MNEQQAAAQYLYTRLTGNAGVTALAGARVYESLAPQGTTLPCVVYHLQAGRDRNAVGAGSRLFSRPLFLVKAVCEGSGYAPADAVAAAIDTALVGASGTVTIGGQLYEVAVAGREEPVRYTESATGKRYNHSGGLYRLFVQGV